MHVEILAVLLNEGDPLPVAWQGESLRLAPGQAVRGLQDFDDGNRAGIPFLLPEQRKDGMSRFGGISLAPIDGKDVITNLTQAIFLVPPIISTGADEFVFVAQDNAPLDGFMTVKSAV